MAKLLNQCNFNLILIGRSQEKLEEVKKTMVSDLRVVKVAYIVLDFETDNVGTIYNALEMCMQANEITEVKLVINNVGMMMTGPVINTSIPDAIKQLNVNLRSHFALTTFFENRINKSRKGDLSGMIFVGSGLGEYPVPYFGLYPYCKRVMYNLCKTVNNMHGYYYRTLNVMPGQVLTNLNNPLRSTYPDYRKVPATKRAGSMFVSAPECARYILLNFGFVEETAGHPKHELYRQYNGVIFYLLRLRLLGTVRTQLEKEGKIDPTIQKVEFATPAAAPEVQPQMEQKPVVVEPPKEA